MEISNADATAKKITLKRAPSCKPNLFLRPVGYHINLLPIYIYFGVRVYSMVRSRRRKRASDGMVSGVMRGVTKWASDRRKWVESPPSSSPSSPSPASPSPSRGAFTQARKNTLIELLFDNSREALPHRPKLSHVVDALQVVWAEVRLQYSSTSIMGLYFAWSIAVDVNGNISAYPLYANISRPLIYVLTSVLFIRILPLDTRRGAKSRYLRPSSSSSIYIETYLYIA